MFAHKYYARYFAQRYFPATPAAEGSLSATASGHAIVVATLSAAGLAQAGLLGAGAVAAWISSGCGFIGAALFGVSSLKANVSAMGALQPAPSIVLSWGRARATTYTSVWNAPPAVGFRVSAAARIVTPRRKSPSSAKDQPQKNRSAKQRVSLARELKRMIVEKAKPSAVTDAQQRAAVRLVTKDGATLREAGAAFDLTRKSGINFSPTRMWKMKNAVRFAAAVFFIAPFSRSYAEDAGAVVSTVVRREGYRCDTPIKTTRDAADSVPEEEAWILKCKNATYRVRLVPHSLSHVEILQK